MKKPFRNASCLFLLGVFTIAISVMVNSYQSHYALEKILQRPILSFVELLAINDYRLLENRKVTFPAFFAADRRFYMNSEQSQLANPHASFGVVYNEDMDGCINSYVYVSANLKFNSNQHGYVLTDIDKFSKVGLIKEMSDSTNNMKDMLGLINRKVLCN